MWITDDPVADFNRWDAEQERERKKLPVCELCGERIEDEYCYDLGDIVICEDCLNKHFRKMTERYME